MDLLDIVYICCHSKPFITVTLSDSEESYGSIGRFFVALLLRMTGVEGFGMTGTGENSE
ncbi:MAG: hypothetical protein M0P77_04735 [Firmicutes bacterium]|nr:hypothetical protein [Bacillota bacterium]